MNLKSIAGNPLKVDSFYFVANSGIGITLTEGGYSQILKLNKAGEIMNRLFFHKPFRRNTGYSPLSLLNDSTRIFAVGEQGFNQSNSSRGFTILGLSLDLDTLWRIRAPNSSQFDSPTSIICGNNKIYIIGISNYIDIPRERMLPSFLKVFLSS